MRPDGAVPDLPAPIPAHPALAEVFAALDAAGIAWCLLRGEAALADPSGDVDLLVAESDLALLHTTLTRIDFRRVPAWGEGNHRGYLGRDAATGRFFALDVEWDVAFGPSGPPAVNWLRPTLSTDAAAGVLARRRRVDAVEPAVTVPAADDAFWLLLLHCVVDKGTVAPRHTARLAELVASARPDGVLGGIVTAHCPPGWDAERAMAAVRGGQWAELSALGARLPPPATAVGRVAAFGRGVRRLGARTGQRRGLRRGLSVAVLGPDGAGKSTLVSALAAAFPVPTAVVYMGLWGGEGDGDSPSLPTAVLAAARRPFRSWARAFVVRVHQARGRLVVLDRHPYDALLPPPPPYVLLKRIFFAMLARTALAPTLVLVLDLPAEVTARRRPGEDPVALATARTDYLALARRLPQAVVLDADRAPEVLRADAAAQVWRVLSADPRGRSG